MTIYETDFSEYSTGSQPSDWTEELNVTDGTINVRNDGDVGVNCLEIAHSTGGRYFTSWDDPGDDDDVEILAKVRITASYDHAGRLVIRGAGSDGNEECYFAGIQPTVDTIFIHKYTPTSTSVGSTSKTIATNTWYWVRFRVNGSDLKLKVWEDGTAEPGSWDIEETDTDISAVGFVGVGGYNDGADVDYFAVGTDGDSPVTPAKVRITHAGAEVIRKGDPDVRITHGAIEALRKGDPDVRITHGAIEVLRALPPVNLRITQADVEILRIGDPAIVITQADAEVLRGGDPKIAITQADVEVLISLTDVGNPGNFFLCF